MSVPTRLLMLTIYALFCLQLHAQEAMEEDLFADDEEETISLEADDDGETEETLDLEENDSALFETGAEEAKAEKAWPVDLGGDVGLEYRFFHDHGLDQGMDYHHNFSFYLQPEFGYRWNQGRQSVVFKPFWRYDRNDSRRTHFDIRELAWHGNWGSWSAHVGIDKVFWGVTESRHTVDIINQTDLVENSDTEDKLGQPMVRVDYSHMTWGTFSVFYLPVSRIARFPGKQGRLRPFLPISASAKHAGNASTTHQDFALRWARTFGYWDIGLVYFRGVTREPRFRLNFTSNWQPSSLTPVYEVIDQVGLDIQGVTGNWLWKFEGFHRAGQGKSFQQLTAGFEYTFSGVFETGADLGFLAEFLYDNRENQFPLINFVPFEEDLFIGTRLALNDVQSTELLAGVTIDLDNATTFYNVEASRRFGEHWKVYLEFRGFVNTDPEDAAYVYRNENYIQAELLYYF